MGNVPFTVYDALGYLTAGAILLVAATITLVGELPTEQTLVTGIAAGMASYIVGHILSSLSSWSLDEVMFNDSWGLGRPEKVLFGEKVSSFPWKLIFRRYYRALPEAIQDRVLERAASEGITKAKGELYPRGLIEHSKAVVQRHQSFGPRIDRYEMLTIFLRNNSAAFAAAAVILLLAPAEHAIELETGRGATTS